jgi:ABC-type dipeptide/oligopeptide/nickel transport system ATPase component
MLTANITNLTVNRENVQITLLKEVHFELDSNCIFSIAGKNGSGKTTFIKSLTGLLDKRFYTTVGNVIFEGRDLLSLDNEKLRIIHKDKIKYVFQDARNSFDQLKKFKYYFGKINVSAQEIEETLAYFLLPKSSELLSLHPYEVSGGMAQRISLVLALLAHPSIIILDEPTSGVDSAIANLFLLRLKGFVEGNSCSVMLVTQDLSFANMISDKIALLVNGKLTQFLPPNEFFKSQENVLADNLINSYLQLTA